MTDSERSQLVEEIRAAVARDLCARLRSLMVLMVWITALACLVMYFALRS